MPALTATELFAAVREQMPTTTINYNDSATVSLKDGRVTVTHRPDPIPELPSVDLVERLQEACGLKANSEAQLTLLEYSYQSGSERACYGRHGNSTFSGIHHPDGACEGGGVCRWCGRTLIFV